MSLCDGMGVMYPRWYGFILFIPQNIIRTVSLLNFIFHSSGMCCLGHLSSDVAGGPYMVRSCMADPSFLAMLLSLDTFIYNLTSFILCITCVFLIVYFILSIRNLSLTLAFSCFHTPSINNVIPLLVFFPHKN